MPQLNNWKASGKEQRKSRKTPQNVRRKRKQRNVWRKKLKGSHYREPFFIVPMI